MGQLVRAVAASRKSVELFKSLKKVTVVMNPFDRRSTTAREFVRRVRAPPVKKSNPKLEVRVEMSEEYGTAKIAIEYADGLKQEIASSGLKVVEILDRVEGVARWKGSDVSNPFEEMRRRRAKALGLE